MQETLPAPDTVSDVPAGFHDRDIMVLIPVRKEIEVGMFYTVLGFWDRSRMRLDIKYRDSNIARSRNRLATRFLRSRCTWSLWLDDDMMFPFGHAGGFRWICGNAEWTRRIPDKFLNFSTPDRLTSHGKTIVGGTYYDRHGHDSIMMGNQPGNPHAIPSDAIFPVDYVGTGCLLVHRQVYLDIMELYPEVAPDMSEGALKEDSNFFTEFKDDAGRHTVGEDDAFQRRARAAGHQAYLDLGLVCGHVGRAVYGLPDPVKIKH